MPAMDLFTDAMHVICSRESQNLAAGFAEESPRVSACRLSSVFVEFVTRTAVTPHVGNV